MKNKTTASFLSGYENSLLLIWLAWFVSIVTIALFIGKGFQLNSNILDLLPEQERKPFIEKAIHQQGVSHGNTVIWLSGSENIHDAYEQAVILEQSLNDSGLFATTSLSLASQNQGQAYHDMLPWKQRFLTPNDRVLLENNPGDFIENRYKALFSPAAMQRLATLEQDPAFTLGNYFTSLEPEQSAELYKDAAVFHRDNMSWVMLISKTPVSGLTINQQTGLVRLAEKLEKVYQQKDMQLLYSGLPIYSAKGAVSAESEITTVGLASVTLIVLVFVFVFLSLRPLLLALSSIGAGIISAIVASHWIFGEIHVITLVFGSSLIGVSVDYALHYLCDHYFYPTTKDNSAAYRQSTLQRVFRGITLGMASSVITYSALSLTPFPGLQQIAVFAGIGLFASWMTVCALFPFASRQPGRAKTLPFQRLYPLLLDAWPAFAKRFRTPIFLSIMVFSLAGFYQLHSDDDIRNMQSVDQQLLEKEARIRAILKQDRGSRFFVVTGSSIEQITAKEQELKQHLQDLVNDHKLRAYRAISDVYFPPTEQLSHQLLYQESLIDSGYLQAFLEKLNMQAGKIEQILLSEKALASKNQPLGINQWLQFAGNEWQANWLGCKDKTCASIVNIYGGKDIAALEAIANRDPGIHFVDRVQDISQLLGEYRHKAVIYVSVALVLICLLIGLNLGLKSALSIISIPFAAIILTIATLGHLSGSYSLFNVFALLLVLGISLDYAIFQHISGSHQKSTTLAITLSLITSLLAFGMLSFSQTHVIHAFGLTLALGIAYAFILSPLLPVRSLEVKNDD